MIQPISQDEKEYVLVSLVLLFCPDMLDLVERPKVEKMNVFVNSSITQWFKSTIAQWLKSTIAQLVIC